MAIKAMCSPTGTRSRGRKAEGTLTIGGEAGWGRGGEGAENGVSQVSAMKKN